MTWRLEAVKESEGAVEACRLAEEEETERVRLRSPKGGGKRDILGYGFVNRPGSTHDWVEGANSGGRLGGRAKISILT